MGNRCNLNLESAGCLSASSDNFVDAAVVFVVVDVVVDAAVVFAAVDVVVDADVFIDV